MSGDRALFSLELTEKMQVARKIRDMLGDRCKLPQIMSDDEMMAACYAGFRYKNPDVKDVLVIFLDNTDGKADITVKTKGEICPLCQHNTLKPEIERGTYLCSWCNTRFDALQITCPEEWEKQHCKACGQRTKDRCSACGKELPDKLLKGQEFHNPKGRAEKVKIP